MNKIRPMVSILCLAFNHEKFIADAIESFLSQRTNFDYEIVIGEDASTDSTIEVIKKYQSLYSDKIYLICSEYNVGMVENMRRTQRACRGKYIALCEGDDYWNDSFKLQKQVEFLEKNPDFSLCFHDAIRSGGPSQLEGHFVCRDLRNLTTQELLEGPQIPTLTVCYRNVLGDIPAYFNNLPILDLCLWSMLGEHGRGAFLKEIRPAVYRIHAGGAISLKNQFSKNSMTIVTLVALARYWELRGFLQISRRILMKSLIISIKQLSASQQLTLGFLSLVRLPVDLVKRILYFTERGR